MRPAPSVTATPKMLDSTSVRNLRSLYWSRCSNLGRLLGLAQGVFLRLELAVQLLDATTCQYLFGHLHAMNQNPLDVPLRRTERLIHKVVIDFFQHAVTTAVDPDRELGANKGRAGGVDLIQDGKHPLLHEFGRRLTGGLAHQVSPAPNPQDQGIDKLDAMLRPTHDGHRGRGLHEEIIQAGVCCLCLLAGRTHHLGELTRLAFSTGRLLRPLAQGDRQVTGEHGSDQQAEERDPLFDEVDAKGMEGRDDEISEGEKGYHGTEDGCIASARDCQGQHHEQIDDRNVGNGWVEMEHNNDCGDQQGPGTRQYAIEQIAKHADLLIALDGQDMFNSTHCTTSLRSANTSTSLRSLSGRLLACEQ